MERGGVQWVISCSLGEYSHNVHCVTILTAKDVSLWVRAWCVCVWVCACECVCVCVCACVCVCVKEKKQWRFRNLAEILNIIIFREEAEYPRGGYCEMGARHPSR